MKRGITGNENDVTMSLPDHSGQSGGGAIRSALIVHRENLVPLIFPYAAQRSIPNDPGGTHQQIKRSRPKVASNGCCVCHIKCAAIRCPDYPAGLCETRCERFSQVASGSCDDQVFHVCRWCDGSLKSRKCGDFQEHGKKLGITSGRTGETLLDFKTQEVIPVLCSALPSLFLPWNPYGYDGEQAIFRFIHTMKKKIL